ncbi:Uu.00g118590.m01.CDS01 [Anthostomella pinea]|uniref:1-alkyl-2-acetylglycerophosphocholine esterase n=1 Tax=Anthostomella pinea TaxID=933095 RepID=A0AAI8VHE6_9PEZI|nr:Uu.00g118590.m01.CDS01 [Anthostomella pinea]
MSFVDHIRLDPYAPAPQPRDLAVSLFYPTADDADRHFKPARQFPKKFVAYWNDMASQNVPASAPRGSSRLFYSDYAEELASYGWNIVTIDHTYEAPIVVYPDGRVVTSNLSEVAVSGGVVTPEIFDPSRIPGLGDRRRLRTDSVGAVGGSFGGATAYQAMANDTRFAAGGNFDGELFGTSVLEDTDKPFLFLASLTHNYTNDPSWREAWPHLKGFKRIFGVANTEHPSFLDWVVLRQILGDTFPHAISAAIGAINGTRMLAVERAFTKAFFDRFLKGRGGELLDGKGLDAWPDITWIKEPPASGLYPS